jgi:glutathionyl-hydroquinone reductase
MVTRYSHMATSGTDGRLKIRDLRTYKPVHEYFTLYGATSLDFSQRGLLASSRLNKVEVIFALLCYSFTKNRSGKTFMERNRRSLI